MLDCAVYMAAMEIMVNRFNTPVPGVLRASNGSIWVSPMSEVFAHGLLPIVAVSCHGCAQIPSNLSPNGCFGEFVQFTRN